jgi:hypothetical protein
MLKSNLGIRSKVLRQRLCNFFLWRVWFWTLYLPPDSHTFLFFSSHCSLQVTGCMIRASWMIIP